MRNQTSTDRTGARVGLSFIALVGAVLLCLPSTANAQFSNPTPEPVFTVVPERQPMSGRERREWLTEGLFAPKSLGSGVMIGAWQTARHSPKEWQGPSSFSKRLLAYEAENGISKSIEASLGMVWGEDPRPMRSRRSGFGSRLGFAMETVVLAPRADGHLAPAWGRFAGAVGSNVVANAWLPSRLTTSKETARRVAAGLIGRLAMNLWVEFGPDLRSRFTRRSPSRPADSQRTAPRVIE